MASTLYCCISCDSELLTGPNAWIRFSRRYITHNSIDTFELLPACLTDVDEHEGSKTLRGCRFKVLTCKGCNKKIGLRCTGTIPDKTMYMDRIFLREPQIRAREMKGDRLINLDIKEPDSETVPSLNGEVKDAPEITETGETSSVNHISPIDPDKDIPGANLNDMDVTASVHEQNPSLPSIMTALAAQGTMIKQVLETLNTLKAEVAAVKEMLASVQSEKHFALPLVGDEVSFREYHGRLWGSPQDQKHVVRHSIQDTASPANVLANVNDGDGEDGLLADKDGYGESLFATTLRGLQSSSIVKDNVQGSRGTLQGTPRSAAQSAIPMAKSQPHGNENQTYFGRDLNIDDLQDADYSPSERSGSATKGSEYYADATGQSDSRILTSFRSTDYTGSSPRKQNSRGIRRGPGRPRLNRPAQSNVNRLPIPEWEMPGWDPHADAGASSQRGSIVRRGFGGSPLSVTAGHAKRQRLHETLPKRRDENGLLIMANGMVDGRSLRGRKSSHGQHNSRDMTNSDSGGGGRNFQTNIPSKRKASPDHTGLPSSELPANKENTREITSSKQERGTTMNHEQVMSMIYPDRYKKRGKVP